MAEKSKAPARWTYDVSSEAIKPRGTEKCLKRAVEKLGPFKQRWHADAKIHGPWGGPADLPLSEEFAIRQVDLLAQEFNRHSVLEREAPRLGHVLKQLADLEERAGELARGLLALDDEARRLLHTGGAGIGCYLKYVNSSVIEAADVPGLPLPRAGAEAEPAATWVGRLEALSRYFGLVQGNMLLANGIADADRPDKGGNVNVYKERYGSASWHLANQGWHIHHCFKPDTATGSEGGAFHYFLMDVFEYATGLKAVEHSKLMPSIKQVVKTNRLLAELKKREDDLLARQNAVECDLVLSLSQRETRLQEIDRELIALNQEYGQLWSAMYPFAKVAAA